MRGSHDRSLQIAYIHGRIEAQLEAFAHSIGIQPSELTTRVGTLLLGVPKRGTEDRVSDLPSDTTRPHKAVESMALARSARSRKAQKAYWAKMTEEQRQKEVARRAAVARKNKEKRTLLSALRVKTNLTKKVA